MAQKILFISGVDDYLSLGSLVDSLKRANFDVEETTETERLEEAMCNNEVGLIIAWGPARWFVPTIQEARDQGSNIPMILIWAGLKEPTRIEGVLNIRGPVLPPELIATIKWDP